MLLHGYKHLFDLVMAIDISSILGAEIIKTEEDSKTQSLLVTLLIDQDPNQLATEKKIRFDHVTHYSRSDIPHEGYPVILDITEVVPDIDKSFDVDQNRKRFKIDTSTGILILEFGAYEMLD